MSKLRLFQTVILFHPTEEESKAGKNTIVVKEPKTVLAKDDKAAAMKANLEIPTEYHEKLEQIEILVVNF